MTALVDSAPIHAHHFRAMGVHVELFVAAADPWASQQAMHAAERELRRLEQIFTRFSPTSELQQLNLVRTRRCSPELLAVIALAIEARDSSGGTFDPLLLDAMESNGYRDDFAILQSRTDVETRDPAPRTGDVYVVDDTVQLTGNARLDLGGIAKGWIVDRVCEQLSAAGPCLVNAGGDIAVSGHRSPWSISIPRPSGDMTVELTCGAIATSGTDRRRWRDPATGDALHHIIDPTTLRPSATDLERVTVVARSCTEAEILAKQLLLSGADEARKAATRQGIPAVLIHCDGSETVLGGLA